MKKVIAIILLIITFFNLIQPLQIYATDTSETSEQKTLEDTIDSDTVTIKSDGVSRKEVLKSTPTKGAVVANILANIGNTIAFTIASGLSFITNTFPITIYDIVFSQNNLFDANFLLDTGNTNKIHNTIKTQIESWYYTIRNIAIALSLCVLLYIGIRMAISTLSEDKAKYKKMLISWLQSFILIFFLHYIILISMVVSNAIFNLIQNLAKAVTGGSAIPLVEYKIYMTVFIESFTGLGWNAVAHSIIFWIIVVYQVKFFFLYAKRVLAVAFLIIISPLVTVTYAIDKVGDGKAQAFKTWFKEFEVNILIKCLHALLYVLFIVSADQIIARAPLLAAVFFMGMSRAEKVVKSIFDARGMKSIHSMGKGKKKK